MGFSRNIGVSLFLVVLITAVIATPQSARADTTYTAIRDGDWDDPDVWGGTAPPTIVPESDTVAIPAGIEVWIPVGLNVDLFGTLTNRGTLRVPVVAELNIRPGGVLVNEGTVRITVRGLVKVSSGTLDNYGTIEVLRYQANVGRLSVDGGTLTNHPGAYLDIGGSFFASFGADVVNHGIVDVSVSSPFRSGLMVFYSNTTLDNYGSITIDQQLRTQDPTAVIYNHPGATIVNNKLLNVGPGLLVNDSLIENNDDLTNEEGGEIHQLCSGSITGNAVIGTPSVDVCDTTPPIIVSSVTGDLGNDGWYTGLLLVSWSVSDPDGLVLSQLGCGTSSVVVDTPGYTQTCMATSYGGTTSVDVTVKRDATAPVVSAAMSPGPNGHGWNHSDVTVTFSATDNLSGVASCDAPITISAEGAGQSASGTCIDVAGSTSSATASGINVDKTVPVVAFSGNAGTYGLGDTINIGCSATDALSGVLSSICPSVTGPAYTFDTSVTHTLYASADDLAGNADSASTSFVIEVTEDGVDSVIKALFENPNAAAKLEKQLDKALGASVNKQPKELAKVEDLVQKNVDKGRLTQEEADLILELLAVLSE